MSRVSRCRTDGAMHPAGEREFVQLPDEPVELGATGTSLAPAEPPMHAVAWCIVVTTCAHAALRGVRLSGLELALEGDVDLRGIPAVEHGGAAGTAAAACQPDARRRGG